VFSAKAVFARRGFTVRRNVGSTPPPTEILPRVTLDVEEVTSSLVSNEISGSWVVNQLLPVPKRSTGGARL
jgi:hypothetical protein